MAMCRRFGISRSHYLGGSAIWTQDDRDLAEAYEELLARRCQRCGTVEEDWRDTTTKQALVPPRFMAVPMRCPGCEETERVQDTIPDGERGAYVALMPWSD